MSKGLSTSLGAKILGGGNNDLANMFSDSSGKVDTDKLNATIGAISNFIGDVGESLARRVLGDRIVDSVKNHFNNKQLMNTPNATRTTYDYGGNSSGSNFSTGGSSEDRGGFSSSGFGSGGSDPQNEDRGGSYY